MRIPVFVPYTLSIGAAAAILAGCSGGSNPSVNPMVAGSYARSHARPGYSVLYSFKGGMDGAVPMATLLDFKGTLYGTTSQGGVNGKGTVFSVSTSGHENVLHSFGGAGDGQDPLSELIHVEGRFYGTTMQGGAKGYGTVFSIAPSGRETVLHSFQGIENDGSSPCAGLINAGGILYGTTRDGGSGTFKKGTVFTIAPGSNAYNLLYSFTGYPNGGHPQAEVVELGGTLYGTTVAGANAKNLGTVFSITTGGIENRIHGFKGSPHDGAHPFANLVSVNGTLYGTTRDDGANGYGTVFSITPSGDETIIYNFAGGSGDGQWPTGGLINVKGTPLRHDGAGRRFGMPLQRRLRSDL